MFSMSRCHYRTSVDIKHRGEETETSTICEMTRVSGSRRLGRLTPHRSVLGLGDPHRCQR